MKTKFYFYFILGLLLFTVYSSCKKDKGNVASEFELRQYNSNLKRLTGVIGKLHNEGITEALSNNKEGLIGAGKSLLPMSPTIYTTPPLNGTYNELDLKNIISSIYDYVLSQPEFFGSERGIPQQVVPDLVSIVNEPNPATINLKIDATITLLRQQNYISLREAGMIKELQNIFINGYALNMTQINAGIYFTDKLDELRAKYADIEWGINEGEGFLGMLEIATSSNQYWHEVQSLDLEDPIVQVDMGAYVLAWGWLVYNEAMAGTLQSRDQWKRISRSTQAAITASTLRTIKIYSVPINTLIVNEAVLIPPRVIGKPDSPAVLGQYFPEPLTTDFVYYSMLPMHIGVNLAPSVKIHIYKKGDQYFYAPNCDPLYILPNGYYVLKKDLLTQKYYQIVNGRVFKIGKASNKPNATLPPYVWENPFKLIL
ncbi:hypothetical protein [Pedobacter nyackensis]|uniref:hypothetical protein n=1 Tax=Pedobacter nyackensis TaxID=475255 RepID=UPI00292FC395|nr:hypothetical protein [Pedobacter nyackensis]